MQAGFLIFAARAKLLIGFEAEGFAFGCGWSLPERWRLRDKKIYEDDLDGNVQVHTGGFPEGIQGAQHGP
jgi:hypothetical protein